MVKEKSNFGNSCMETQNFGDFSLQIAKFGNFCPESVRGTFDVELSLAKGTIFLKIGLANGTILKLWAAHPYPKFS